MKHVRNELVPEVVHYDTPPCEQIDKDCISRFGSVFPGSLCRRLLRSDYSILRREEQRMVASSRVQICLDNIFCFFLFRIEILLSLVVSPFSFIFHPLDIREHCRSVSWLIRDLFVGPPFTPAIDDIEVSISRLEYALPDDLVWRLHDYRKKINKRYSIPLNERFEPVASFLEAVCGDHQVGDDCWCRTFAVFMSDPHHLETEMVEELTEESIGQIDVEFFAGVRAVLATKRGNLVFVSSIKGNDVFLGINPDGSCYIR